MNVQPLLSTLGLICTLVGALLLYQTTMIKSVIYAAFSSPSHANEDFNRRQSRLARGGFSLVAVGSLVQVIATWWPPVSLPARTVLAISASAFLILGAVPILWFLLTRQPWYRGILSVLVLRLEDRPFVVTENVHQFLQAVTAAICIIIAIAFLIIALLVPTDLSLSWLWFSIVPVIYGLLGWFLGKKELVLFDRAWLFRLESQYPDPTTWRIAQFTGPDLHGSLHRLREDLIASSLPDAEQDERARRWIVNRARRSGYVFRNEKIRSWAESVP